MESEGGGSPEANVEQNAQTSAVTPRLETPAGAPVKRGWSAFARRSPRPSSSAPDHKVPPLDAQLAQAEAAAAAAPQAATPVLASLPRSSSSPLASAASHTVPAQTSPTSASSSSPLATSASVTLQSSLSSSNLTAERRSGLKWFQRKTPPNMTSEHKELVSPREHDKKEAACHKEKDKEKEKESIHTSQTAVETISSVSYADLKRQLDLLKRENTRLRFENSHLFKELDIVHRRLSLKLKPAQSHTSSLDILTTHTTYSYNVDTNLTLNIPLDEFLAQYYQDYPESLADLTIYQRKGKLASFSIRNSSDASEEDERSKIKESLETALISQEDGKFQNPEGQPRHESFIPTIVKRQFARDVPSMVRINGKMVNGRTENEKVLVAYRILHDGLAGNEKLVNLVMSLATQNLGIFMYEKLVKHYQQIGMIVKQSWHHYLDISLSGVNISKYTNNKNVINDLVEEYLRKERAEREAQQQLNSGSATPGRGGSGIRSSRTSASSSMDSDVIYMSDEESSMSEREDTASQPRRPVKRRDRKTRRRRSAKSADVPEDQIDEEKAKLVEGIGIYMLAIFELQNTDLDGAPLFIKGMMEISFRNTPDGGSVHVLYSTPAFDVLSFIHSVDLDATPSSTPTSTEESEEAETETETDEHVQARHQHQHQQATAPDEPGHGGNEQPTTETGKGHSEERHHHLHHQGSSNKMKEVHGDEQGKEADHCNARPDNQEPPAGATHGDFELHDNSARVVVLKKGRRRRLVELGAEGDVEVDAGTRAEDASAVAAVRKEDEEWFRRMDEQSCSQASPLRHSRD